MHVNYVRLTFHVIVYKKHFQTVILIVFTKHFLNIMAFVKHLLDVTV